jgi:uncharacterized protein YjbI with pentapeptide repeats
MDVGFRGCAMKYDLLELLSREELIERCKRLAREKIRGADLRLADLRLAKLRGAYLEERG